jgi:ABC-type multidrug transport system fused ATPase/permease subunit
MRFLVDQGIQIIVFLIAGALVIESIRRLRKARADKGMLATYQEALGRTCPAALTWLTYKYVLTRLSLAKSRTADHPALTVTYLGDALSLLKCIKSSAARAIEEELLKLKQDADMQDMREGIQAQYQKTEQAMIDLQVPPDVCHRLWSLVEAQASSRGQAVISRVLAGIMLIIAVIVLILQLTFSWVLIAAGLALVAAVLLFCSIC